MINKMYRVLSIFCIALVLPILVSAEQQAPKALGNTIAPPLVAGIKLNAINKLRQELKMPPLSPASTPPPANVILTSAAPAVGQSNLTVIGMYSPFQGLIAVRFINSPDIGALDKVRLRFATIPGKTYLLDVSIKGTTTWIAYDMHNNPKQVKAEQGHLLIPFIASGVSYHVDLSPADNNGAREARWHDFYRAELTQVN